MVLLILTSSIVAINYFFPDSGFALFAHVTRSQPQVSILFLVSRLELSIFLFYKLIEYISQSRYNKLEFKKKLFVPEFFRDDHQVGAGQYHTRIRHTHGS